MKKQMVLLGLVCLSCACGSSDDSSACDLSAESIDASKITAVSKGSGSDKSCPELTPADLNDDSGDAGPDDPACEPTVDKSACTATSSCTVDGVKSSASLKKEGSSITGTLSLEGKFGGSETIMCVYNITAK